MKSAHSSRRNALILSGLVALSAAGVALVRVTRHAPAAASAVAVAVDSGAVDAGLPLAEFGFPGPMRDALVASILRGEKTSTTELHEEHRRKGTPVDEVGARALLVDSQGRGVAVIETTAVAIKPMGAVDLAFAIDEGEGFKTVGEWKAAHRAFFTCPEMKAFLGDPPFTVDDRTLVVCYRFRVVERIRR